MMPQPDAGPAMVPYGFLQEVRLGDDPDHPRMVVGDGKRLDVVLPKQLVGLLQRVVRGDRDRPDIDVDRFGLVAFGKKTGIVKGGTVAGRTVAEEQGADALVAARARLDAADVVTLREFSNPA